MTRSPTRQGTLLIIVAGLSAMLAVLATTFLLETKARNERPSLAVREAQARLALYAACSFIVECNGGREGIYPIYPLTWHPDHRNSGYKMGSGMNGWVVEGARDPQPRPAPSGYGASTSATIQWDPIRACPTDTWFRIRGNGLTVEVTVGVGRSRGIDNVGEGGMIRAELRQALGVPINASDLQEIIEEEYRERWQVTYSSVNGGRITSLQRL